MFVARYLRSSHFIDCKQSNFTERVIFRQLNSMHLLPGYNIQHLNRVCFLV